MDRLKLRKVGNSIVVTIPTGMLNHYGLKEGDGVKVGQWANGIMLRPDRTSRLDRQLKTAERIMDENKEALARLAK